MLYRGDKSVRLLGLVRSAESQLVTLCPKQAAEPAIYLLRENEVEINCIAVTQYLEIVFAVNISEEMKANGKHI